MSLYSSFLYGCALRFAGFMGLLPPVAAWESLGFFVFVSFILVRLGCRLVSSGSSASFKSALGVAGFFQFHLVRSGAPWGCWVRSVSCCSHGCALRVAEFIWVGSLRPVVGSFGFDWCVRVRAGCHVVHFVSSRSSWYALGIYWFVSVGLVHPSAP